MGSDRDSHGAAAAARHDGNYLPNAGAAGMILRSGGDSNGNGAGHRRRESAPPDPQARTRHSADVLPTEVAELLRATGNGDREKAWDDFLAKHSRLLLHVARKVMPGADSAMDAYANVLERLRRDDCRAIAGYQPDGRSQFTTWLVVVTRRMCVDFYRQRYGRPRGEEPSSATLVEREARRRLATFAGVDDVQAQIADYQSPGPEGALRNAQLQQALDSAIAALQPEDQLLLKLRFHDELPAKRIAPILAMPSQFHVYRRLNAVCAELRSALLARGIEDGTP